MAEEKKEKPTIGQLTDTGLGEGDKIQLAHHWFEGHVRDNMRQETGQEPDEAEVADATSHVLCLMLKLCTELERQGKLKQLD